MFTWMIPPVPSFSAALAYQKTCHKKRPTKTSTPCRVKCAATFIVWAWVCYLNQFISILSWKELQRCCSEPKVKPGQLPLEHTWPQFLLFDRQSGYLQANSCVYCSSIFVPSQCKSPPTAMMQSEFWIAKLAYAALKKTNHQISDDHQKLMNLNGVLLRLWPMHAQHVHG